MHPTHAPHPCARSLAQFIGLNNHTWFGHLIDDVVSNTYRALRFVKDRKYGELLYSEFTSVQDWHYDTPVHYELFNMSLDPHQVYILRWRPYHESTTCIPYGGTLRRVAVVGGACLPCLWCVVRAAALLSCCLVLPLQLKNLYYLDETPRALLEELQALLLAHWGCAGQTCP